MKVQLALVQWYSRAKGYGMVEFPALEPYTSAIFFENRVVAGFSPPPMEGEVVFCVLENHYGEWRAEILDRL